MLTRATARIIGVLASPARDADLAHEFTDGRVLAQAPAVGAAALDGTGRPGEGEGEGGPFPRRGLQGDVAAHGVDEGPDDVEADPGAFPPAALGELRPPELLEAAGGVLRGHADPVVGDAHPHPALVGGGADDDGPVLVRELEGVRDEVVDDADRKSTRLN